jgi:DNA repair protein RecO (recombination protein O)
MKIYDEGFFLYSKNFGEKSKILYVLSKDYGLIKGLSKSFKNKNNNLINLDKIKFTWSSRNQGSLGYLTFEQENYTLSNDSFFRIIKASASELCLKFLPLWEQNISIYKAIKNLSLLKYDSNSYLIGKYVEWEINFLKHLGYGLDINKCCITGELNTTHFISPKTGNAVNFEVGRKYSKHLFKIPKCMKENFKQNKYDDYKEALKITEYFFLKILENKKFKFIFRDQIINKL